MNQYNAGEIYQLISSIIGILVGLALIFFRKKIIDAQKKYASKRKGFPYDNYTKEPTEYLYLLAPVIGFFSSF